VRLVGEVVKMKLQLYEFEVVYCVGACHANADAMT